MPSGEMSEHDKIRFAVVKAFRAVANSWDRYPNNRFTGREVADGLRSVAQNLETKINRPTIIKP